MNYKDGILLDRIYEMSTCEHLSDLKYEMTKAETMKVIRQFNLADYSPSQWSYAFSYITCRDIEFSSMEEVEQFIQNAQSRNAW